MKSEAVFDRRLLVHRALADETRLAIVDALALSDRTPTELRRLVAAPSNLLTFHLDTLQRAGLVARSKSQGDARRRYVGLTAAALPLVVPAAQPTPAMVLFVCTHNAARSQFARALWLARTGRRALSAGARPADTVDPTAVEVAQARGLDLATAEPCGYGAIDTAPDLVVSVCDRAAEAGLPFDAPRLHWSVADPRGGNRAAFDAAFDTIAARMDRLVSSVRA
ncbi:MAG: helix-turn-helix domain-containing protein [Actinomycetota bacterium]|nr:helix-turn-helix domain-containing protein [Actinomycetota bacterium]